MIDIYIPNRKLDLPVDEEVLKTRTATPPEREVRGALKRYALLSTLADSGAILEAGDSG